MTRPVATVSGDALQGVGEVDLLALNKVPAKGFPLPFRRKKWKQQQSKNVEIRSSGKSDVINVEEAPPRVEPSACQ